jgi:DNA-binding IclR family transcriptional regulator
VSLADLALRTGLPKASLHRLCRQLVEQGALDRTDHGYRLGFRMFELGSQVVAPGRLRTITVPYMAELHTATGCAVNLSVLSGGRLMVLNAISGRATLRYALVPGRVLPILGTASGKSLLERAPTEVRDAAFAVAGRSVRALERELALHEVGTPARAWEEGALRAISVPIHDRRERAVAALSVSGPSLTGGQKQLIASLRNTAAAIESSISRVPAISAPAVGVASTARR